MHIYAFGSVCRGEVDLGSDIDLLACVDHDAPHIDRDKYSVYRYHRLRALWQEGCPFAWHLHLESRLLFASDGDDFLRNLGQPAPYRNLAQDFTKFRRLFEHSHDELHGSPANATFNLSCIFLAVRNLATCHTLAMGIPIFSRDAPLRVEPNLQIPADAFSVLLRARLLSTRGHGEPITPAEIRTTLAALSVVPAWMENLWTNSTTASMPSA